MKKNVVIILLGVVLILSVMYSMRVQTEAGRCQKMVEQTEAASAKARKDADMERDRLKDLVNHLNSENAILLARLKNCEK